jgi:murein DD-endopeptidase MepM/ murein hydrolase activator NlpD
MSSFFQPFAATCCLIILFASPVGSSALRDGLTSQLPSTSISPKLASQSLLQELPQPDTGTPRSTATTTVNADQSQLLAYPQQLRFPLIGAAPISSPFGDRVHPISGQRKTHQGIDFAADHGTPVVAALSGQVTYVGDYGGYGTVVAIRHNSNFYTFYAHLSETYVQTGTWVEQSTIIASVGSTGYSTGPHLHFEVRLVKDGVWYAVDPALYLGKSP